MPNWCSNGVRIRHNDPMKIKLLKDACLEEKFCNFAIPVPAALKDTMAGSYGDEAKQRALEQQEADNLAKYGYKNWYDFCTNEWGTKWDVQFDSCEVSDDGLELTGSFESAWAPPVGVYDALTAEGYEVTAYYYEPGMCFVGKYDNGDDECLEFGGETSKTVRDAIGEELDDYFCISEQMAEYEEENEEPEEELTEWYKEGVEQTKLTPHQ